MFVLFWFDAIQFIHSFGGQVFLDYSLFVSMPTLVCLTGSWCWCSFKVFLPQTHFSRGKQPKLVNLRGGVISGNEAVKLTTDTALNIFFVFQTGFILGGFVMLFNWMNLDTKFGCGLFGSRFQQLLRPLLLLRFLILRGHLLFDRTCQEPHLQLPLIGLRCSLRCSFVCFVPAISCPFSDPFLSPHLLCYNGPSTTYPITFELDMPRVQPPQHHCLSRFSVVFPFRAMHRR